jgi:hypothetical protein
MPASLDSMRFEGHIKEDLMDWANNIKSKYEFIFVRTECVSITPTNNTASHSKNETYSSISHFRLVGGFTRFMKEDPPFPQIEHAWLPSSPTNRP